MEEDENSAFIRKIDDLYNSYHSMDYYSILGIDRNVTLSIIREAYYKRAKEFHPDRHFHIESETTQKKLTVLFSYFTEAFKTLSDPEERKKYDQDLKSAVSRTKDNNIEIARLKFGEGKIAFKKGLYQDAAELFGQAIYLDNSIPDYHFALAKAYWKQKKLREAEKAMSKALKIDPYNAEYLSEIGHIYLELGLKLRAKSNFEKAIKVDRNNKRALEGLNKI